MPDHPTLPIVAPEILEPADSDAVATAAVSGGRRKLLTGGLAAGPVLFAASTRSALAYECRSPSAAFSGNVSSPGMPTCAGGSSPDVLKTDFSKWASVDVPSFQQRSSTPPYTYSDTTTTAWTLAQFMPTSGPPAKPPEVRIKPVVNNCGPYDFGASFKSIFSDAHGLKPVVPNLTGSGSCSSYHDYTVNASRDVSLWEILAYPADVSAGLGLISGVNLGEFARCVAAAYLNALTVPTYPVSPMQVQAMWTDAFAAGFCPVATCTIPWTAADIKKYLERTWDPSWTLQV